MSEESPASSRAGSSTRPALDPKFSSIGASRPESSNASARKSWSQSHRDAHDEEQLRNGSTSSPAAGSEENQIARGPGKKLRHSRDSGGFLRDSSLRVSKRKRTASKNANVEHKGTQNTTQEGDESFHRDQINTMPGLGILAPQEQSLGSTTNSALGDGTTDDHVGQSKRLSDIKGKGRLSSRNSQGSSNRASGSPRSTQQADSVMEESDLFGSQSEQSPAIDPAQIVQMALSLNESRKASLNPGQLAAWPSPNARRATSAGFSPNIGPAQGVRLRQSWQPGSQSQVPGSGSRGALLSNISEARFATGSPGPSRNRDRTPSGFVDAELDYSFSPATLLRAEKARAYIELSYEYRRLLQYLPPLKPRAAHVRVASSDISTGSPSNPAVELGRPYNPLQFRRNKSVRTRERDHLHPEADGWNDPESVRDWVDSVEEESKNPGFKLGDVAVLPDWKEPLPPQTPLEDGFPMSQVETAVGVAPGSLKSKRRRLDWSAPPADLFADAYWMEQADNKGLIESTDGTRLFKKFQRPKTADRTSREGNRARTTPNEPWSSSTTSPVSPEEQGRMSTETEGSIDEEYYQDLSANQRPPSGAGDSKASRAVRRLFGRRRNVSTGETQTSHSDEEPPGPVLRKRAKTENTGPLEKHMTLIMANESRIESSAPNYTPAHTEDQSARRGGVSEEYKQNNESSAKSAAENVSNNHSVDSFSG